MGIVSYAQNFEDVMLWRALKDVKNGFYIDIGANDPNIYSVTKIFYQYGWRGINIEPVQSWFDKLKSEREEDINLQLAVGAENGTIDFYEVVDSGLSTIDKTIAENHAIKYGFKIKNYSIPIETLTKIYTDNNLDIVHFLKIDVEGAEKIVLEGIDFSIIRPWIVLVEATIPMSQDTNHEEWEFLIISKDYHFVYFDGLNRFYVSNEHKELDIYFQTPPNIFDDFISANHRDYFIKSNDWEIKINKAEKRVSKAEKRVSRAEERASRAELKLSEVEARANEIIYQYDMVTQSNSWKIMKPFRIAGKFTRWFFIGSKAWLSFSPPSRPRRMLKKMLISSKHKINTKPKIKNMIINMLDKFPSIKLRLKRVGQYQDQDSIVHHIVHKRKLSLNAQKIYDEFSQKLQQNQKGT